MVNASCGLSARSHAPDGSISMSAKASASAALIRSHAQKPEPAIALAETERTCHEKVVVPKKHKRLAACSMWPTSSTT